VNISLTGSHKSSQSEHVIKCDKNNRPTCEQSHEQATEDDEEEQQRNIPLIVKALALGRITTFLSNASHHSAAQIMIFRKRNE
jgi:hypothetical protein